MIHHQHAQLLSPGSFDEVLCEQLEIVLAIPAASLCAGITTDMASMRSLMIVRTSQRPLRKEHQFPW